MSNHQHRLMEIALQSAIGYFHENDGFWTGNSLSLATFWFLHNQTYASRPITEVDYSDNFNFRLGLERMGIEFESVDALQLQDLQSTRFRKQETINAYSDEHIGLITFGPGESFWEAAGAMEIAKRDYIVFPQHIAGGWTEIARPDGTAFRLGELQNVLAEIGFIPRGADTT